MARQIETRQLRLVAYDGRIWSSRGSDPVGKGYHPPRMVEVMVGEDNGIQGLATVDAFEHMGKKQVLDVWIVGARIDDNKMIRVAKQRRICAGGWRKGGRRQGQMRPRPTICMRRVVRV